MGAETTRSYGFTSSAGAIPGTLALAGAASGSAVGGLQTGRVWVDADALELAADPGGAHFVGTLYFESVYQSATSLDHQDATLQYGYIPTGGGVGSFVALASQTVTLQNERRNLTDEQALGLTKTAADIGVARFDFPVDGELPEGAHIAIRLATTGPNTLYTVASNLGSRSPSTATVPLPELPGLVLFSVGALAVLGVVHARRK